MSGDHHHHDDPEDLFEPIVELPDEDFRTRYDRLVGLDDTKATLLREARALLDPAMLRNWSERHHGSVIAALDAVTERFPLFIFEGDVGTGKTALAETFGSALAVELDIPVRLYRMSLSVRGRGLVGEMTALISAAFDRVAREAHSGRNADGSARAGAVLVLDEADAISQSRDHGEMHHEDRAGVNALIRGLDTLAAGHLPVLVVLCTNRGDAIDAAVRRRAARSFTFRRPGVEQRRTLLSSLLEGAGLSAEAIEDVAATMGESEAHGWAYTYSDIVQRVVPGAILAAAPDRPLTESVLLEAVREHPPTSPFGSGA